MAKKTARFHIDEYQLELIKRITQIDDEDDAIEHFFSVVLEADIDPQSVLNALKPEEMLQ